MIVHKLYVEGYKIMGEPLQLEFPEKGRIGILGQNESGKSTLLESITTALFGLGKGANVSREDLVTWGKEKARLELEFSSGNQRYLLTREIAVNRGHRAKLISIINGEKDDKNSITNITEIQKKIEEITGMGRDSFTKLIYIRQKDLDALKELYKARREQLVNKVMGIEIFDVASRKVAEEISEIEKQLLEKRPKLDVVRANKDQYEIKLDKRKALEKEIKNLEPAFIEKKASFEQTKEELEMYDWLFKFKSTKDLIISKEGELSQVESEEKRLKELEDQLRKYSSIVQENDTKVGNLQKLLLAYKNIEDQNLRIQQQMIRVQTEKETFILNLGLSDKELKFTTKGLMKEKSQQLNRTGLAFLFGSIGLLLALINPLLVSIGFAIFFLVVYFFSQYLKVDKLIPKIAFVESYNRQINELQYKITRFTKQMDDLRGQSSFESSQQVMNELNTVFASVKDQTGQETFEGLKAVTEGLRNEVKKVRSSDFEKRAKDIRGELQIRKDELQEIVNVKPKMPDGALYEEARHKSFKELFEKAREEYNNIDTDIYTKKILIKDFDNDLETLKPDFELYPILENEVSEFDGKLNVLNMVDFELCETSRELRTKIIPQARFVINQILPIFTDGRYSEFEITEDLRFKVHSVDAGDYKEREIFSGGTQDQFLIALRLAFTQSILDSRVMADKYSLLMDECISSSDEVRKQGIFEVLDAMKQTFAQIFIIAHEDISSFVDHYVVLTRNHRGYTEIRSKSW